MKKSNGAIVLRYAGQSMVEGFFEKIEVADEGQCRRTWRQNFFVGIRENKF